MPEAMWLRRCKFTQNNFILRIFPAKKVFINLFLSPFSHLSLSPFSLPHQTDGIFIIVIFCGYGNTLLWQLTLSEDHFH